MPCRANVAVRTIRPAEPKDRPAILALAAAAAEAGDAFPWEGEVSKEELGRHWLPDLQQKAEVFVCEATGHASLAGVYALRPTGGPSGRCAHMAGCLYLVAHAVRGCGLGKALCAHSVRQAKQRGYSAVLLQNVVATNAAAVATFASCGFQTACTLPRAFRHERLGLVDSHVMLHNLEDVEPGSARPAGRGEPVSNCHRPLSSALATIPGGSPPPRGLAAAQQVLLGEPEKAALTAPCVVAADGASLAFPGAGSVVTVAVGEQVNLQPRLGGAAAGVELSGAKFMVQPQLPTGLSINKSTGAIVGAPAGASATTRYKVTATLSLELPLQVEEAPAALQASPSIASLQINEDFATCLESVKDVVDLPREPAKTRSYGDWMIWMVHRAWLNDPALADLNFSNMHMPPEHVEARIAPKLMQAMRTNTHITTLTLFNCNLQKPQAVELAVALRSNVTLRSLNLECNWLDSMAVRELALAIGANPKCPIEHLRFSHQKQMGQFFGRPTEEAVGQMMERNEFVVKLGFECDDAHWRNLIDRALLRNNDYLRRRDAKENVEELPPADVKTLGNLLLKQPPELGAADVVANRDFHLMGLFHYYVLQNRKLPTTSQLQNCAKNSGRPLPYYKAAPLIRECRSELLRGSVGKQVVVTDAFGMQSEGTLRSWSEINNENWKVEVCTESGKRMSFKTSSEPAFSVSKAFADWLWSRCPSATPQQPGDAAAPPGASPAKCPAGAVCVVSGSRQAAPAGA